ncbi:MAG: hypothetical protein J2P36_22445 [Ktedonobacteraceae bacterium]|nr:hypothetical protein [Ktedonobacteraceae bacterium]
MAIPEVIDNVAQYMELRKKTGQRPYHLLLVCQQDIPLAAQGYLALARLMKEQYFSTILTIDCEQALEQALLDLRIEPSEYKKLTVGHDTDEQRIVDALDDELVGICVVMLEQQKQGMKGNKRLTPEIQAALQRYLNLEIVIAGFIEDTHDILTAFLPQKENAIYVVLPAEETLQSRMSNALTRQGKQPIFIPEPYNTFDKFFDYLATKLIPADNNRVVKPVERKKPPLSTPPKQPSRSKQTSHSSKKLKTDLLLVTTTAVETEAILTHVPQKRRVSIRNRAYHDLGMIGEARTLLVQLPHMGSGGSGGSLKTIEAAIQALSPWAVIMVGIAFGFDPANQRIGDILISQKIQDYDLERVGSGSGKYARGNRVSASALLLGNFITSQYYLFENWPDPPKVYPGLILSGSKLVDDEDFRDQLRMIAPDAVGGEMEGVGLYEAASNKHVDWLLVKAISDWADGKKHLNKKEFQQLAAEHAARFTIKAIELGGFARPAKR